jgi:cytochrome P450
VFRERRGLFAVPYQAKLDVIMDGEPFFLSMQDTPAYHAGANAMREVVRPEDVPAFGSPRPARRWRRGSSRRGRGGWKSWTAWCGRVTFGLLADYFGVPKPANGDLRVWGTRLFEFQFADGGNDPALARGGGRDRAGAARPYRHGDRAAPRRRPTAGTTCWPAAWSKQATGEPGFSDVEIRTGLMGFIVGGPPQPPMVVPQALEQLLRRPDALAGAQQAARDGDDALLAGYVFEAMRFDPLAPALPRVATVSDGRIAAGTSRARAVKQGDQCDGRA